MSNKLNVIFTFRHFADTTIQRVIQKAHASVGHFWKHQRDSPGSYNTTWKAGGRRQELKPNFWHLTDIWWCNVQELVHVPECCAQLCMGTRTAAQSSSRISSSAPQTGNRWPSKKKERRKRQWNSKDNSVGCKQFAVTCSENELQQHVALARDKLTVTLWRVRFLRHDLLKLHLDKVQGSRTPWGKSSRLAVEGLSKYPWARHLTPRWPCMAANRRWCVNVWMRGINCTALWIKALYKCTAFSVTLWEGGGREWRGVRGGGGGLPGSPSSRPTQRRHSSPQIPQALATLWGPNAFPVPPGNVHLASEAYGFPLHLSFRALFKHPKAC